MDKLRYALVMLAAVAAFHPAVTAQTLRPIGSDPERGQSAAVIVEDAPLVHTAQLLPTSEGGGLAASDDARAQFDKLLDRLDEVLRRADSDRSRLVKLNVYLTREDLRSMAERSLVARFGRDQRPAVSYVVTPLPVDGALVAVDAVAVADVSPRRESVVLLGDAAVLPAGSRVYISGQAESGTLREATRKTLASLKATLEHCGRSEGDIVQLKCFLTPMALADEVLDEVGQHFRPNRTPPVSLVEWRSSLQIEIEVVAWGGPANADAPQPLEFVTPPGMSASPLFSRVARIHRGGTIYFSDFHGPADTTPAAELEGAYESLRELAQQSGTDLAHLAKATYYVADAETSRAHNEVRPKYYDPERPPAASKAVVAGTGRAGLRYVMDMIAIPARQGPNARQLP
jgi:enamine deaminase RidA (YjgF/YER057c/UK114 family)